MPSLSCSTRSEWDSCRGVIRTTSPIVTGFVLIGGRSRRLGIDKACFPLDGIPAADRIADRLADVCDGGVRLVGRDLAPWSSFPSIPDSRIELGPLGGVLTALECAESGLALIVATDLWEVTSSTMAKLVSAAGIDEGNGPPDLVVAVPASNHDESGRSQPLCAVWNVRSSREVVRDRIDTGQYSMYGAVDALRSVAVIVDDHELLNVNTPEDLEAYERDRPQDR